MNGRYKAGDKVFGNWTLVKLIGEGSFGQVFEAEREDFGRVYKAAIKIITIPQSQSEIQSIRADGLDDESVTAYLRGFVEELVDEFALMSQLKGHSNIVSYEDHMVQAHTETVGWDIMIRMELLTPLLQYVRENTMTQRDVIKLGIDMCKALELCQKYKIVHRDIKPENIFVSPAGDYKLGDFGIARTVEKTTSGLSKKGTYTYMAPEIYLGQPYGTTVDIYSLGIVLYWLLNESRSPFLPPYPAPITHSDRENALRTRMCGAPIPAPKNADDRLAEIVLNACAYDPKDRYSSPMQMRQELLEILYDRKEAATMSPEEGGVPARSAPEIPVDEPTVLLDASESPEGAESVFSVRMTENTSDPFDRADDAGEQGEKEDDVFQAAEDDETAGPLGHTEESRSSEVVSTGLDHTGDATAAGNVVGKKSQKVLPSKNSKIKVWAPVLAGSALSLIVFCFFAFHTASPSATPSPPAPSVTLPSSATPAVVWRDPTIEAGVRDALGKANEDIYLEDLAEIEEFRLGLQKGETITTLYDLRYMPNLKVLDLSGITVASTAGLEEKMELEALNLTGCDCPDGAIPDTLSKIRNLAIGGNKFTELSFTQNMQHLTYLDISDDPIVDLSPLADKQELETLRASNILAEDWGPVSHVASVIGLPEPSSEPTPDPTPDPTPPPRENAKPTQKEKPKPTQKPKNPPAPVVIPEPVVTPEPVQIPPPVQTPPPVPATINATGISLSRGSLILEVGGMATLSATVTPSNATNKNVSWSSSNPSVVRVSGGTVTAMSPGTATITAGCDGFSASCTVTVN